MNKFFLLLLFIFLSLDLSATIEYIIVNEVTREFSIIEDGRAIEYDGLFWQYRKTNHREKTISALISNGYRKTDFRFTIEIVIIFLVLVLLFPIRICLKKTKKTASNNG